MIDYSELELKFKEFRRQLLKYREVCELLDCNQHNKKITEKEEKMRSKLTQTYGELATLIHGMAGYVKKIYSAVSVDIFMLALSPTIVLTEEKKWGIESSIQCLDKAIGACKYAKSVEKKGDQIIIHRGADIEGWLIIIKIFKEAKRTIWIQDRYINEEIFSIVKALNPSIDIKILIQKELYREKETLKLIYNKYKEAEGNVVIRELTSKQFHSREIIIDRQKGYDLTFSIKDVGKADGRIHNN